MKITCHACDAKYTIADEKVTGRTVKIKCKKCGATIVVNADPSAAPQVGGAAAGYGDVQAAPAGGDDDGMMATRVAGMDGAPSVSTPDWTVSLGEQERQMSQLQIAEEMQRGTVTADTYVWRDGMADWLSIAQVPELAALLARAAAPAAHAQPAYAQAPAPAAQAPAPVHDDSHGLAGTIVMGEGAPMSPFAAPRPAAGMAAAPAPAATPAPQASAAAPGLAAVNQPTAARRANRAGASVDVFAAAETRDAPVERERPRPPTPAGKLGERNENSVLFSLSALTATETAAAKGGKPDDGVIDFGMGNGKSGGSAVDDLMNIGGSGIGGGPMLAPPPLLAPVVEPPPAPAPAPVAMAQSPMSMNATAMAIPPSPPKSKTGLIIGVVAGVLVLGGLGAVFALGGGGGSGSASGSGNAAVESTGATSASSAPATTAAPPPTTAASNDTPAASGAPVASSGVGSGDPGNKTPTGTGTGGGTSPKASSSASSAPTASAKATTDTPTPTATAVADSGGAQRDFNKGAATTALAAAAGAARGCKTADGPTGSASVRVVFAPSGNVTSANVQGPPFAGTPVGGCIAAAFRGAHVPPFDGSPVAVSKTVNIN